MGNPAPLKFGSCFDHLDRLIEAVFFSSGFWLLFLLLTKAKFMRAMQRTQMRKEQTCEEKRDAKITKMRLKQGCEENKMREKKQRCDENRDAMRTDMRREQIEESSISIHDDQQTDQEHHRL